MPRLKYNVNPDYRLHKQSGLAIVTLDGRDVLLGRHGTEESRREYERRIAEWRVGRLSGASPSKPSYDALIAELLNTYRQHVEKHYRHRDGTPTTEGTTIRFALRPLLHLYGDTLGRDFGSLQLEALRERMIHPPDGKPGWTRLSVNKQIGRVRRFFKWCVSKRLLPGSIMEELRSVAPLEEGRTDARETEKIKPVPLAFVESVIPHLSRRVAAMVRLQLLTGARPGEICAMRTADVDRGGKVWIYRPRQHKTRHRGHAREIRIGPKAQEILAPFLRLDMAAYVFSPAESEAERREKAHAMRKTPLNCGNVAGEGNVEAPKRTAGDHYTTTSYRRAIQRACDAAFPPPLDLARIKITGARGQRREKGGEWRKRLGAEGMERLRQWRREYRWHPHQLRHRAATEIRREHGLDMARIVLGQETLEAAEIYAEADGNRAMAIMEQIG